MNPTRTAKMGVLRLKDRLGAEYVLPNMNVEDVRRILPEKGRVPTDALAFFVNVSLCTLSVPFRIVQRVFIDAEEVWNAGG